ncbi:MAG: gliding motility-associated C-terminal domain-containing protein [Bacteroidetes bacterium]|nr:gliding motility-associated C-terminal domain-containing protein [Bacteroidota bacterium]
MKKLLIILLTHSCGALVSFSQCNADFQEAFDPICIGQPQAFANISDPPNDGSYTYTWNFGAGATPANYVGANPPPVIYSTLGNKNVTLTISKPSIGCNDVQNRNFDVVASPNVSFTSTAPQCVSSAVDFTYTGTTAISYQWDFGVGASPQSSSVQNPQGVTYSTAGTKTVTLTIDNGLCQVTTTQTISIESLPVADAGTDTVICPNASVQIGSAALPDVVYAWSPSGSLVIADPSVSNPVVSPVAEITNITVFLLDTLTGCSNTDSVQITMLQPIIANAGADVTICRNDSVQIGNGFIESQLYAWNMANGISDTTASNPVVKPDSTITYVLNVSNDYGCPSETDEVTVVVNQLPDAYAGLDDSITTGETAQLVATGGIQYEWTPDYELSSSGIYNPLASPETSTTYTVTVTDVYGCINSDTVDVIVITPSYWIPNAFTPSAATNNVLYVRGDGITDFQFRIYNRHGELIFYSSSLSSGWDGTRQITREDLPEGAYLYDIQGILSDGTELHESGLVNLIR